MTYFVKQDDPIAPWWVVWREATPPQRTAQFIFEREAVAVCAALNQLETHQTAMMHPLLGGITPNEWRGIWYRWRHGRAREGWHMLWWLLRDYGWLRRVHPWPHPERPR